ITCQPREQGIHHEICTRHGVARAVPRSIPGNPCEPDSTFVTPVTNRPGQRTTYPHGVAGGQGRSPEASTAAHEKSGRTPIQTAGARSDPTTAVTSGRRSLARTAATAGTAAADGPRAGHGPGAE